MDNAPCCVVLECCTAPFLPGVDVSCVGQESSHKCIVVVSCPSVGRCKGRLERPCMIAWCTQRRRDYKRFRGDAMPFFFFKIQLSAALPPVHFTGVINRSRSRLGVITVLDGLIMPESATVRVTCVSQSGGTVLSVSGPDHFYSSVRSLNFCGRPSEPADGRMDENEPRYEHSLSRHGQEHGIVAFGDSFTEGRVSPWGSYAADDGRFDRKS